MTAGGDRTAKVWDLAPAASEPSPLSQRHDLHRGHQAFKEGITLELDIREWDLAPSVLPAADLRTRGELLTGHALDDGGGAVPLDSSKVAALRQALAAQDPGAFAASAREARAWHEREAQEAEVTGRWSLAEAHLDRLMSDPPAAWDLFVRRGRARLARGAEAEAAADYSRALALSRDEALRVAPARGRGLRRRPAGRPRRPGTWPGRPRPRPPSRPSCPPRLGPGRAGALGGGGRLPGQGRRPGGRIPPGPEPERRPRACVPTTPPATARPARACSGSSARRTNRKSPGGWPGPARSAPMPGSIAPAPCTWPSRRPRATRRIPPP